MAVIPLRVIHRRRVCAWGQSIRKCNNAQSSHLLLYAVSGLWFSGWDDVLLLRTHVLFCMCRSLTVAIQQLLFSHSSNVAAGAPHSYVDNSWHFVVLLVATLLCVRDTLLLLAKQVTDSSMDSTGVRDGLTGGDELYGELQAHYDSVLEVIPVTSQRAQSSSSIIDQCVTIVHQYC